ALGAGLRIGGIFEDLPFSFHGDETHFVKRSVALGTGDLNPHWFHKSAFLMYVLLFFYGSYYLLGSTLGWFESVGQFGAHFLHSPGPFVLIGRCVVAACGIATVYVVYRIARRAFGSFHAGLSAALVAAVLFPMVVSSQEVKEDVACGFLVALSFLYYVRTLDEPGWRPFLIACLLAGAAMGTKYYGIILVPVYVAAELARRFTRDAPWRRVLARASLVVLLFLAGFFVTSPYNFLDPTWMREEIAPKLGALVGKGETERYDPDNDVRYVVGPGTYVRAAGHFWEKAAGGNALGPVFTVLCAFGFAVAVANRRTRTYALLVGAPVAMFWLIASVFYSFHVNPRHLNALYPLLCTLVAPAVLYLARLARVPPSREAVAAILFVALACAPGVADAVNHDVAVSRLDSRVKSYEWIVRNVPKDARILLDEYGPQLQPNPAALARLQARLGALPPSEAFTRHQRQRFDLLRRYPPDDAFDIDELGHPWWLPHEMPDEQLRASFRHRDMGDPLISRLPRTLEEYRRDGIRYVITNSASQARYFENDAVRKNFPSFVRFYNELRVLEPLNVFRPREWGGKGPVVTIYDIAAGG
ncbi:MAG: glycosyltransferase family 39 protein, partial [Planctomycetota bacterium]